MEYLIRLDEKEGEIIVTDVLNQSLEHHSIITGERPLDSLIKYHIELVTKMYNQYYGINE